MEELLQEKWNQFLEYERLVDIGEIARRYFAMNAFDGVLTIIGLLIGSYTAGVKEPVVIISAGFGTSIAMGVSGLWGAYLTESAERKRELDVLENQVLSDLDGSKIHRASRWAAVVVAIVDGLAPFLAALVVLTPFFLTSMGLTIWHSYYAALIIAMVTLFILGVFLGYVSRERVLLSGVKMIAAGVVAALVSYFLRVGA